MDGRIVAGSSVLRVEMLSVFPEEPTAKGSVYEAKYDTREGRVTMFSSIVDVLDDELEVLRCIHIQRHHALDEATRTVAKAIQQWRDEGRWGGRQ